MKKLNHLSMIFFCDIEVDAEDDLKHHKKTWNKKYKSWNVNSKGQTPEKQEDVDVVYSMIINPSMDLEAPT